MKRLGAVLWVLALAAAYGLGARSSSSGEQASIPLASFASAIDYRSPLLHLYEISRFLRNLDPQDLPDVLAVVEAAGFWFKEQDHHLLMAAWVPIDALAAMDWARSRPGTLGRRARSATMEEFAFHDPLRALSFVTSIDSPELQQNLQLYMIRGWARSNHRDGLTEYLFKQPMSVARQQAITAPTRCRAVGGRRSPSRNSAVRFQPATSPSNSAMIGSAAACRGTRWTVAAPSPVTIVPGTCASRETATG